MLVSLVGSAGGLQKHHVYLTAFPGKDALFTGSQLYQDDFPYSPQKSPSALRQRSCYQSASSQVRPDPHATTGAGSKGLLSLGGARCLEMEPPLLPL